MPLVRSAARPPRTKRSGVTSRSTLAQVDQPREWVWSLYALGGTESATVKSRIVEEALLSLSSRRNVSVTVPKGLTRSTKVNSLGT